MLARVHSGSLVGIDAYPVEVEIDVYSGLPSIAVVGLPDSAVRESAARAKSAIVNSGYPFPARRITVSLAPADLKKQGSGFQFWVHHT
jgi:magnesium chelatase family protein